MIKLSIIIPHYNSPDLLRKLLDSIPKRKEIEIIVVDDKSDKHLNKLNNLIKKFSVNHIQFYKNHKDDKGAGVCRNIGLEKSIGEWVLFADADDYFIDGFYDIVYNYLKSDYDVVFFSPTSEYVDSHKKADRHLNMKQILFNYKNKSDDKYELYLRYKIPTPWSKLIKKKFINDHNIKFDEVIASNDIMFSTKVGHYMNYYKVENKTIYCVTRNKGSLTVTRNERNFDSRLSVYINKIKFLYNNLTDNELEYFTLTGQGFIFNAIKFGFGFKKTFKVIKKFRNNNIPLFDRKILNPIYFLKKLHNHYLIEKKNKKYISK